MMMNLRSHHLASKHVGSQQQGSLHADALRGRGRNPPSFPRGKSVAAAAASVPLTLEVAKKVEFGESIKAVGNDGTLGNWAMDKAVALEWSEGDVWKGTVNIPVGQPLRFKLVKVSKKAGAVWEEGSDRELVAQGPDFGLRATCDWNDTKATSVESFELGKAGSDSKAPAQVKAAPAAPAAAAAAPAPAAPDSAGSDNGQVSSSGPSDMEQQAGSSRAWVGAAPEFVRSRQDAARQGAWKTEGLTGVALELVKGDEKSSNWLSKLDIIKSLLVDRSPKMRPALDEMAFCYVYATWINTGAIRCAEGGGHHRPNHHANLALQMFKSLEWVIGDNSQLYSPKGVASDSLSIMAARRMHNCLPSINGEFRQSVPLTRIRDIAHRGDIPQDLKNEIKHTLQNKLHRCAGPEDLVASEAMLKKITANPGEFNNAFVDEFKLFMKELREFFNASGLEDLLIRTQAQGALEEAHSSAVTQLLASKKRVEAAGSTPSLEELMTLLFSATQVRTFYAAGLSAGLRNDVTDEALEMRQRWRLSDIRLEEYSFVVLSRIVNVLEEQGGPVALSTAGNNAWALPLSALTAGLRNLGLSQFKPKELLALENELQTWHSLAPLVQGGKDNALRAKASLDRVIRLTAQYSDSLMAVYSKPAADLGKGLNVEAYMASIFGESEVRSSVAYQVSKLALLMSKALRIAAGQSAWDGLVTGEAVGVLHEVASLSPSVVEELVKASKGQAKDVVLVVQAATGDEELGPLVPLGLRGVVLRQELPHLSHLGVRARQEKVTFATLDDNELFESAIKPLLGKSVRLDVLASGEVTLKESKGEKAAQKAVVVEAAASTSEAAGWSAAKLSSSPTLVPLTDALAEQCGAKAAKCADLQRLAAGAASLFRTPIGCCLPFGTMELAVAAAGSAVATEYKTVLAELELATGDALELACKKMQSLVEKLALPGDLLDKVCATFGSSSLLAVRSSANVEDLAGMSAAGLYESVVGVAVSDPAAVSRAVGTVWASLYARRAVMTRRAMSDWIASLDAIPLEELSAEAKAKVRAVVELKIPEADRPSLFRGGHLAAANRLRELLQAGASGAAGGGGGSGAGAAGGRSGASAAHAGFVEDVALTAFARALRGAVAEDVGGGMQLLSLGPDQHFPTNSHPENRCALLVRDFYPRLLERIEASPVPAALLTGMPGTGKSWWIWYAVHVLLNRAADGSAPAPAIVWQSCRRSANRCALFKDGKAFVGRVEAFDEELAKPSTWYFADGVLPYWYKARTVMVCPPNHSLSKEWTKGLAITLLMPLWTWPEMEKLWEQLYQSTLELERARRNFELWYGGVPRLVLEHPATEPDESRDKIAVLDAIKSVSLEQVRIAIEGQYDIVPEWTYCIIHQNVDRATFLEIEKRGGQYPWYRADRLYATEHVGELFLEEARLRLRLPASPLETPSSARGQFFETAAHLAVRGGGCFEYKLVDVPCSVPATGEGGRVTNARLAALQAALDEAAAAAAAVAGAAAAGTTPAKVLQLTVPKLEQRFFSAGKQNAVGGFSDAVKPCASPCYLQPDDDDHPVIDACIYPDTLLILNFKAAKGTAGLDEQVLEDHLQCLPDLERYYLDYVVPAELYPSFKPVQLRRSHERVARTVTRVVKVEAKLRPAVLRAAVQLRKGCAARGACFKALTS